MNKKTKICLRCKIRKNISEFNIRNKERGYTQSYCKPCQSWYTKQHYKNNKSPYKLRATKQRIKKKQFIYDFLKSHPCVDCGETNPIVLEFDHLRNKKFMLGNGYIRHSFSEIKSEIEKCEVRCSNCHKIKTAKQQNWYRNLI